MNLKEEQHLSNELKNLIAMGAAMGAGCRTCADKLHGIAQSLNIPEGEMFKAFQMGLSAKAEAVKTMSGKISTLMGNGSEEKKTGFDGCLKSMAAMARIASFVAANSAPDALSEIEKAKTEGITAEQIKMCINLGKMVRKNAMAFSDQEIAEKVSGLQLEPEQGCCPVSPVSNSQAACSCS
jgi:alkylhydroperoxidase/carboxymuconolactone decarboxylase family protein YurZ